MDNKQQQLTPTTATPPAAAVLPNGDALPPEPPLTPQSNNISTEIPVGEAGGLRKPPALEPLVTGEADGIEGGVEVVRAATPKKQDALPGALPTEAEAVEKSYARNMSALSISTGDSIEEEAQTNETSLSFDDDLPETPKSSLVSGKKSLVEPTDAVGGAGASNGVPSKAVDWIPEISKEKEKSRGDGASGVTSQSVKLGDDVTETSFTTMTTAGDMGLERKTSPPPLVTSTTAATSGSSRPRSVKPSRVRTIRGSVPARSPRPPRHMRAVDWCPPSSSGSLNVASAPNRMSVGSLGGSAAMSSDKTAVTSRAVRLGDDATVTTFATMTTMGDAGSILEADTEDEASSSSGSGSDPGTEDEVEGEEVDTVDDEGSMEDVADENGVVDKIPSQAHKKKHAGSLSGTTNHTVRAVDDQSMVTFATMTTFGGMQGNAGTDVVDKVPAIPSVAENSSVVTNDTVQMGDNQSLATWATTNTMGGQLTGNVVDHVPNEAHEADEGVGARGEGDAVSSSNNTVGTSNAVKDDPSVTTFTTTVTAADSGINEVVDSIPTFAGGGGGTGRSVVSGVTSQAIRPSGVSIGGIPDDRSVTSFATMTTMGDLGSIFETEVLPDEDFSRQLGDDTSRPRLFSGNSFGEIDRNVVDVIPEAASSVASGTTNHSVRTGDDTDSVTTFGTMTTAGMRGPARTEMSENNDDGDVVDKVPTYPASVVSGTTNMAVRLNDDQSVATWATSATPAVTGHVNEHMVDKTPEGGGTRAEGGGGGYSSMVSETTDHAIKDPDDQSVVTWNTMTTAGAMSRAQARSPPPPPVSEPYAVDRVPSYSNARAGGPSLSGTTNHPVRATDDQSVVTFATMTTAGGMDRGTAQDHMVDRVPSIPAKTDTSIVTNDTVQMGDNRSLATWATSNTMGGAMTGNVVDHVPSSANEDASHITVGTSNAVKDDPSVTTFTTSATSSRGINEVVDRVPTFAGGGSGIGRSVVSGVTNRAVRMGDDRSIASFATMTTVGDMAGSGGVADNPGRYSNEDHLVDRIPSSAGSIISGRTDAAVRLGDDLTVGTFATMTTAGGEGVGGRGAGSDQSGEENDVMSASASSSSRFNAPTTGILREGRHGRPPSALRDSREYRTSTSDSSNPSQNIADPNDLPINVGESVSNTHILRAIADLRFHVDYRMGELRELNRRDSERVAQIVQAEQQKRTALEARLHSQLLLQSESMVAMELKLLRLEAKVSHRDSRRQQRARQSAGLVGSGTAFTNMTDRLPPIAATPSTPNHSDEEVDSFEEMELTPRGANRRELGSGLYSHQIMQRGGGPANIAVVTRSGASVASAVTQEQFEEGDFPQAIDERSGDDNDDGSASTPTHGTSQNRISNLESILLNPIQGSGGNDQGISTRAIRGDTDGMSSLPTSVTSATVASTIVTATTRGESVGITRISSRASEEDALPEEGVVEDRRGIRSNSGEFSAEDDRAGNRPRSRSQSPLTVQSAATGSLGPSVLSTAAVASSRSFGSRRANAAATIANAQEGSRSMANRVVSFTTSGLSDAGQSGVGLPPQMENDGGGDSITMPDELDNVSDIADAFSNSARVWREEYEARLDAITKRLGG